jgi:hypothetical protein
MSERLLAITTVAVFSLSSLGCQKQKPLVVLDAWWCEDYAKMAISGMERLTLPMFASLENSKRSYKLRLQQTKNAMALISRYFMDQILTPIKRNYGLSVRQWLNLIGCWASILSQATLSKAGG